MCDQGCEERRRLMMDAYLNAKIAQAVGHAFVGAAEMVGIKKKTGKEEMAKREEKGAAE